MTDPFSPTGTSPRHALPLLYAGQAQKEFFVNEALARIDALLAPAIAGTANTPPADAAEGESWLVGSAPEGAWAGQTDRLATFSAGDWIFCAPQTGLRVWDRQSACQRLYRDDWTAPAALEQPDGGQIIDIEARAAIAAIVALLTEAGLAPE